MISVISIEKVKLVHYIVIICLGLIRTFMSLSLSHQPPPPFKILIFGQIATTQGNI